MLKRQFSLSALVVALPIAATVTAAVATAAPPGTVTPVPLTTREVSELTNFTSPSGNIGCYIQPTNVRCDIAERDWNPPPKAASCPEVVSWGQGLQLEAGAPAGFVCAGDTALTDGPALAFGDTIVAGPIECTSNPDGMSCRDVAHGGEFTISRDGYNIR